MRSDHFDWHEPVETEWPARHDAGPAMPVPLGELLEETRIELEEIQRAARACSADANGEGS